MYQQSYTTDLPESDLTAAPWIHHIHKSRSVADEKIEGENAVDDTTQCFAHSHVSLNDLQDLTVTFDIGVCVCVCVCVFGGLLCTADCRSNDFVSLSFVQWFPV